MSYYAIRVNSGGHTKLAKLNDPGFLVEFQIEDDKKQPLLGMDYVLLYPDLKTEQTGELAEGKFSERHAKFAAGRYRLSLKAVHDVRWMPSKPLTVDQKVKLRASAPGFKDDAEGSFEILDPAKPDAAAADKVEGLKVKDGLLEGDWTPTAVKLKDIQGSTVLIRAKVDTKQTLSEPAEVLMKHSFEVTEGEKAGKIVARFLGGPPVEKLLVDGKAEILAPLGRPLLWLQLPLHPAQQITSDGLGGAGVALAEPSVVEGLPPIVPPSHVIEFMLQNEKKEPVVDVDYVLSYPGWEDSKTGTLVDGKVKVKDVPAGRYRLSLKTVHSVKWLPTKRIVIGDTVTLRAEVPGFADNSDGIFEVYDACGMQGARLDSVSGKVRGNALQLDWVAAPERLKDVTSGKLVFVAVIDNKVSAVSELAPVFWKYEVKLDDFEGAKLNARFTDEVEANAVFKGGKAELLAPCGLKMLWLGLPEHPGARLTAETDGKTAELID